MGRPQLDMFQGTLDVLVLRALTGGAQHGYAIARFIRSNSNDTFKILDGALTPRSIEWRSVAGSPLIGGTRVQASARSSMP
jgi:hypothetical protein